MLMRVIIADDFADTPAAIIHCSYAARYRDRSRHFAATTLLRACFVIRAGALF